MKIGIVGGSGYSGGELIRNLFAHPKFEVAYIAAGSHAGERITSIHPHLTGLSGERFEESSIARMNDCDLIFFALPHGESHKYVQELAPDVKVVDLGADYRLKDPALWNKYYGGTHAGSWVYGMPELPGARAAIASATRVANPGCYASAISLAIAPAVSGGFINQGDIVVVASSGVTGAGRSAKVNLLGAETMNSLTSYKFGGAHQHTPEIEQTLNSIGGSESKVSFTPILAPMPRGILATTTALLTSSISIDGLRQAYQEFYRDEQFISILPEGELPRTSSLTGSNSVHIQLAVDTHTNRLIVSSALDNLGKGAAGAAIQNANIICGFDEAAGITAIGVRG